MLRPGRRGESGGLLHADVHCSAWRLVVLGHLVSQVKEKCFNFLLQWAPVYSILFRCGLLVFALLKLCRYHQQENIRVCAFPVLTLLIMVEIPR